jgi:hypothetical protein
MVATPEELALSLSQAEQRCFPVTSMPVCSGGELLATAKAADADLRQMQASAAAYLDAAYRPIKRSSKPPHNASEQPSFR